MKQRRLGNTGILVGEIGMGCEGFVGKDERAAAEFLDVMEEAGANCLDLYTPDPDFRTNLGGALRGRRERFVLQGHLCSVWKEGQYQRTRDLKEVEEGFLDGMARLGAEFLDIGMIHYVDTLSDWETVSRGPVMDFAQRLHQEGKIGCIGLSSHNPQAARAAVESGLIQVLMFSVNPCYDLLPASEHLEELWDEKSYEAPKLNMDPEREGLYEACQKRGVGITVMKAFGGGDLLSPYSPAGVALTPLQCLHYALTRPGVATVFSGARTVEELRESLRYEEAPEEEKDFARAFASFPKISWQGRCMYCGHCAPCPRGIDIASVMKFWNLAKAQGETPETVREHYALLARHAGDCIRCGACETRCPFQVRVTEEMEKAQERFGY